MVKTKGIEQTMKNYEGAIGSVPGKYKDGVSNASGVIAAGVAAEQLWADKMQEAISNRTRAKGLEKSSDEEWKRAALGKGASRIGQGMQESLPKMRTGMGEVLSVIEGVTIAPRTADPMANVDNRVKPIVSEDGKRKRIKQ